MSVDLCANESESCAERWELGLSQSVSLTMVWHNGVAMMGENGKEEGENTRKLNSCLDCQEVRARARAYELSMLITWVGDGGMS